jgi:peptide/nickel transport system ATP-binding protein
MIAMAMSCNPSLLICDEPTTALDVSVQKNILQLIKELQVQNNMGVIFITHDLSVVAELADRVAVMYKGEIVELATTRSLFTQPVHPYTKALLACRPLLHAKGERLPVVSDFMEIDVSGNIVEKNHAVAPKPKMEATAGMTDLPLDESAFNSLPTLFTIDHLKIWYPATKSFFGKPLSYIKAVDDLSFQIFEGETLGLVGESGCGKSTLGRALISLLPATDGHIYYKGFDLCEASESTLQSFRKELQIIFQDPYSSLNPRMTIGEAISEPLFVHHLEPNRQKRRDKVIDLLEKVNLKADHYYRYPHEFSGGQRQRIVIARALAMQPKFLICDESVSALDVSVQAQVLNLLNDLKKEFGFTAVFISHDLSVVRYISDRIIVMQKGKIAETGRAETLYQRPQSAYTRELVAAIPKGIV